MEYNFSIIIPCYCSSDSLYILVDEIKRVARELEINYEIILVDDASPCGETWKAISDIVNKNPQVKGVQLTRNFGREGAVLAGMSLAKGDYIITMDDDLQHNPEDIKKMLDYLEYDVVMVKFPKRYHTFMQRLTSKIYNWIESKYINKPKNIVTTSYRMYSKSINNEILKIKSPFPYSASYIYFLTNRIINITGTHRKRKYGKSNFSFKKRFYLFLNFLINNTTFLLNFMVKFGVLLSFISFLIGLLAIIGKLIGYITLQGWTSIIVLLSFFTGIIIFFLGILGEYMLRILQTVENKPAFVIRTILTENNNEDTV